MTACKRCGADVRSFSPMRKWCVECRRLIGLEQARVRKLNNRHKLQPTKQTIKPSFKLKLSRTGSP